MPHTTETVQWGDNLVLKVGGKMYALANLEPAAHWLSFKCSPEDFTELCEREGVSPAPYFARAQWVAVDSEDTIPRPELKRLLRNAYDLVFAKLPKKTQAALG
ncbi:MAG: MmcQ/YjbR family DNA-binding protein [Candidatus Solibacter sp.]